MAEVTSGSNGTTDQTSFSPSTKEINDSQCVGDKSNTHTSKSHKKKKKKAPATGTSTTDDVINAATHAMKGIQLCPTTDITNGVTNFDNSARSPENRSGGSLMSEGGITTTLPKITLESAKARYDFWATQPVPKFHFGGDGIKDRDGTDDNNGGEEGKESDPAKDHSATPVVYGPILVYKDTPQESLNKSHHPSHAKLVSFRDIRPTPYPLPTGFAWSNLSLEDDEAHVKELYTLLSENYVEDDDNMFRFDYSPQFLKWALRPPGYKPDWHIGIRVCQPNAPNFDEGHDGPAPTPGKLVAFISAIPAHLVVPGGHKLTAVEINFLCVHKKLRSKRIAPVLISEVTRRVNLCSIWYAVYTAGVVLPRPCGVARYWHRSLNPKKLVEIKFSHLTRNLTMGRATKLYKLPDAPATPGFRPLEGRDVKECCALLNAYLTSHFSLYPLFTETEFAHWFLPRPGVIEAYVVENEHDRVITDMVSFYSLPSTVMNHATHKNLYAAYSFYNVVTATPWVELMRDALIVARNSGYDVFNALDLMENRTFLEELKFGIGDGHLNYYLFNWTCPVIKSDRIGLVLQ